MTESITAGEVASLIDMFASVSEPDSGPGVTRLAYTPLERAAHARFAEQMTDLGLTVTTDPAGNTLAELPGSDGTLPALGTGSHLDSVPSGGAFDGIAGVVAALCVARLFAEGNVPHRHAVRFVVFAGEEGARFGQACTGSRLATGLTTAADLDHLLDKDGVSVAAAMRALKMDPNQVDKALWRAEDWSGFIELHVEQGSVLADSGIGIGVVDLISGSTRIKLSLRGRASHTGGTPMCRRADALAAAAEVISYAEHLANDAHHHGTRITVGRLEVGPNSITTIAGTCEVYIDVRDVDSLRQRRSADDLMAKAYQIAARRGVGATAQLLGDASPVLLSSSIQDSIVGATARMGLRYRVMASGASHDAQMVRRIVPTGMIFVPSRNHGVSHSPEEFTTAQELAVGAQVLAQSLLALDETLDRRTVFTGT